MGTFNIIKRRIGLRWGKLNYKHAEFEMFMVYPDEEVSLVITLVWTHTHTNTKCKRGSLQTRPKISVFQKTLLRK